jgi:hypothetical protein
MASVANINDVLEGHVALEIECVDRLYLNAYVPILQVGGEVIGIGRPEEISLVFARPPCRPTRHPYRTRIFSSGTEIRIQFRYKHSRVKQYLEGGRAFRLETVINRPSDLDLPARLHHLPALVDKARAVNQRLLMIEQAGQSCAVGSALYQRIHQPYNREGQRTGALRFGDSSAIALAGALCHLLQALTGFTNKSLRGLVAAHLSQDYNQRQMSYDLRRLRPHGLIQRLPTATPTSSPQKGSESPCSTQNSRTGSCDPSSTPTSHPHPSTSGTPSKPLESAVNRYVNDARLAPAS